MLNFRKRETLKKLALFLQQLPLVACNNNLKTQSEKIDNKKFPKIKLKMATSFPRNLPGADIPAQRLAKKLMLCH